jgi:hypothetical protein
MNYRNAQYNQFGTIDCEIEHPLYGWIAFTANPDDVEPLGKVIFDLAKDNASEYVPPVILPPTLEQERARMTCSPAQMRLALHRAGLLATVQAIADSDPEASIVWEYATQIVRQSPLIEAMGGPNGFTAEQIDDLFRAAMGVQI